MDNFQLLAKRLQQLKVLDGRPLLGRLCESVALNPCLPNQQLEMFEQRYGVILPDDYRRFVLEIGDGGVGPFGKILPLNRFFPLEVNKELDLLRHPFPLDTRWSEDQLTPQELERCQTEGDYYDRLTQGALAISDIGCCISILLIITGRQRGTIWINDLANTSSIEPMENGSSFHHWYSHWLNSLVQKAAESYRYQLT